MRCPGTHAVLFVLGVMASPADFDDTITVGGVADEILHWGLGTPAKHER